MGSQSTELSSHIFTSRGMSFVKEIPGGSGTLSFSKQSVLSFPSLSNSSVPGGEVATVGGCLWDIVASDSVAGEAAAAEVVVAAVAISVTVTFAVAVTAASTMPGPLWAAAVGPGPSTTVG